MDLVAGVKRVVVMEHKGKDGTEEAKLLKRCTLPLTGAGVVDLVITDLGVFAIDKRGGRGMRLIELAPGISVEDIQSGNRGSFCDGSRKQSRVPRRCPASLI